MDTWLIFLSLSLGFLVAYLNLIQNTLIKYNKYLTNISLLVLLFSMGAKIGMDEQILKQISQLGFKALLLSLSAIIGSVLMIFIFFNTKKDLENKNISKIQKEEPVKVDYKDTLIIALAVLMGLGFGVIFLNNTYLQLINKITSYALVFLLFGVGVDIGLNKELLKHLVKYGWSIIVFPFLIALGSILGTAAMGFVIGFNLNESAAIGAGFGWYSLSGILLSELHSAELGSVAFLTNIFREFTTFLILPTVVKYFGQTASIAPGGATTLDVTLPLVKKVGGEEMVIPALISGMILTTLVPILVPFLINL
ncbi:lysine exporter LysO family protein [Halanaerobium praevalens]|uniref:Lysine exporter LysO family protein n=1 Tax=Halanaerobium praevalens (strain ATCC 33744 / DSM 2228 / GSL) TaxID=572479 RepID=E3DNJ9_HALPG|nr:lysine exporter LysO family protein [Halanaerobium praevalens]ADO76537.1 protein of unknown function DUF340 membrane [Halanaerobium praevalens DSM 2228]